MFNFERGNVVDDGNTLKSLQKQIKNKNRKLSSYGAEGNEGYLMIDGEFIKTKEFLSGFEFDKYPLNPIDAQYGNEIQKIMYGDIRPGNLNTLEHNLSHSEQRMMLYILQQLQEQKQKLERGEIIKEEDKIKEIVMFTGRKCCPVCHEALPKFMNYIKKEYKDLVPDKMTVYDFWNRRDYDGDFKNRGYLRYNITITNPTNADYKQNANNYYSYGSNEGVNYNSVFDNEADIQHLSKFVEKINKHRYISTYNTIGDRFYTVESLKGDSGMPIVFSMEELEKIYNEKNINIKQNEVLKLINKVNSLNKQLEDLKGKKEINEETRQLLNNILQNNKYINNARSKTNRFNTLNQNELNIDNLEQIINNITKIVQQDVEEIKKHKDEIIGILDKDIVKKKLEEIQKQSGNTILQRDMDNEITKEEHEEILKIIQTKKEEFKQHVIRYKQSTIALKTLQERQNGEYFNFQNYLKKTFAIENIVTSVQETDVQPSGIIVTPVNINHEIQQSLQN